MSKRHQIILRSKGSRSAAGRKYRRQDKQRLAAITEPVRRARGQVAPLREYIPRPQVVMDNTELHRLINKIIK